MIPRLLPVEPVERALTLATASWSSANGVFYAVSALYFTTVVGLSAGTVGLGLTLAGVVGVVASFGGGYLADHVGADRLVVGATLVQAAALGGYSFATGPTSFTLVACVAVGGRSLQGSARAAMQARWFLGPERVAVRARLRVVTNLGIAAGTGAAAIALAVGTETAYRVAMVAVALACGISALPMARLRGQVVDLGVRLRRALHDDGSPVRGASPLRDRVYLTQVALCSAIAMHFALTTVGIPLWVVTGTAAPGVVVSVLLIVNTAVVTLFQVRAARGTDTVPAAGRAVLGGAVLLVVACVLFALAGDVGAVVATSLLVFGALVAAVGEIRCEAGSWALSFELADPRSAGAYQGVTQTGYALAFMLAPALVTATAVELGWPGWLLLAGIFGGCGLGVLVLSRRVARDGLARPT